MSTQALGVSKDLTRRSVGRVITVAPKESQRRHAERMSQLDLDLSELAVVFRLHDHNSAVPPDILMQTSKVPLV